MILEKKVQSCNSGESTDTATASSVDLGLITVPTTAAMFYCLTPELALLKMLRAVH